MLKRKYLVEGSVQRPIYTMSMSSVQCTRPNDCEWWTLSIHHHPDGGINVLVAVSITNNSSHRSMNMAPTWNQTTHIQCMKLLGKQYRKLSKSAQIQNIFWSDANGTQPNQSEPLQSKKKAQLRKCDVHRLFHFFPSAMRAAWATYQV